MLQNLHTHTLFCDGIDTAEQMVRAAISKGFDSLLMLVAFITINVGVFNLLPVPALDGGRLLFVLIEMIIRRPIPQKYESIIHATGLVLLLGLVVAVTFNDIFKLITG